MGIPLLITPRDQRFFNFGPLRKPSFRSTELDIYIVDANVPMVFGLNNLDEFKMYINNVENVLIGTMPKWEHLITRKLGHLFYE